jgi:hypothetical protein
MPVHLRHSRWCRRREARDLALYLVGRYSRPGTSRRALAREMAVSLSGSGFVHACERVPGRPAEPEDGSHPRLEAVCQRVRDAGNRVWKGRFGPGWLRRRRRWN